MAELSQAGIAAGLYNPLDVSSTLTIKQYVPPDVLEMLDPFWHDFKPETPLKYYIIGFIYFIGGSLAIFGNILVLFIFLKHATLRTPVNLMVMNLAICDLGMCVSLIPENIVSFLMGGIWQFGDLACNVHAFCGTLFGIGQIGTLVFISYDRYNVIVRGMRAKPLSICRSLIFLVIVWIHAALWSVGPFLGYGGYALDGILASCSYAYMDQSVTNIAYIVGMFVSSYVLPLMLIICFYTAIVKAVIGHERAMKEQAKKMNVASLKQNEDQAKQSAEIRIAKVAIINTTLWTIAWTPFAVVCLLGVLGDQKGLTPLVTAIPAIMAKSSCIYNPFIYAISHPRYRVCLFQSCPWICISDPSKDNQSTASEVPKNNDA